MIRFRVKFDHALPRHQHGPIGEPRCDATFMPTGTKGIHGLLVSSPRSEFNVGILLVHGTFALWGRRALHKVEPTTLYAGQRAHALAWPDRLLGKFDNRTL